MTVERMLREMSFSELQEWYAFNKIERSGGLTQNQLNVEDKIRAMFLNMRAGLP